MPTFPLFSRCPICHAPAAYKRVLCRAHLRVLDVREDVDDGARSDWYPTAGDGLPVNHQAMMRTHPSELGHTRYGWQAEVCAILAWMDVRLWNDPGEGGEGSAA